MHTRHYTGGHNERRGLPYRIRGLGRVCRIADRRFGIQRADLAKYLGVGSGKRKEQRHRDDHCRDSHDTWLRIYCFGRQQTDHAAPAAHCRHSGKADAHYQPYTVYRRLFPGRDGDGAGTGPLVHARDAGHGH